MATKSVIPVDLDAIIEEYNRLWPIMTRLHTEISRLLRKDDIFDCARRLRMLGKTGW
jgi:hypothetical protein